MAARIGRWVRRGAYGAFVALVMAANTALSGVVIWITIQIQWWALPVFFGVGMAMVALVFQMLLPRTEARWAKRLPTWARNALAWVRKVATPDDAKFSAGTFWPRVRRYGAFWFVFVGTLVSPLLGAFIARYLKLADRQAWGYTTASTAIGTAIAVSVYLGAVQPIVEWAQGLL